MALNLVQHRCGSSVWERVEEQREWDTERWLIGLGAAAFLAAGVRQRSLAGLMLAVGGSALAWWAFAGADERNQLRGQWRALMARRQRPSDTIGEASEESFPASDAPSWTPTTGNTGPADLPRWH